MKALLDWTITQLEVADAAFHKATGAVDEFIHAQLERAKALRDKLFPPMAAAGPDGPELTNCYESANEEVRAWADSMAKEMNAE